VVIKAAEPLQSRQGNEDNEQWCVPEPISGCAGQLQSGKSAGNDFAATYTSILNYEGASACIVAFVNPAYNQEVAPHHSC
jgi:hypothetical protein